MNGDSELYWIGLTDEEKEGDFRWVDNSLLDNKTRLWASGQPNSGDSEDCVKIQVSTSCSEKANWHDYNCGGLSKYICERAATLLHI
ncbi:hepatic lectin-like [Polypterus senegalus]|uniref:hepatic lectin-like n=1 Tax=Polypterus senegalus TaxID=55291 RepID=UPI0019668AEC|nr:hepatic lectin-like [Polypterus senegalus]